MKYLATALLLSASFVHAADISISDARVRAVPPGANISAAFMNVKNNAATDLAILSAESTVAQSVELHSNSMVDGKMKMRRIDQLELAGNSEVSLQPGGLHIMLIGLKRTLAEGETIELKLNLSDNTSEVLQIPVVHIEPGMKKMEH